MSKFLFVLLLLLMTTGLVAFKYRRGLVALFRIYLQIREARRITLRNQEEVRRKSKKEDALEMRVCKNCSRWFQSDGQAICLECIGITVRK